MKRNYQRLPRNKTNVALRESEERFRSTFEQAAIGIAHVTLEGRFLRINQRFCDIVGYTKEEILKHTFQDITHPDDLDIDLEYSRQILSGEIQTFSMEKRYFKKNDSFLWVYLTVSLVRKSSGEPNYFITAVEDISKQKQAEQALRKAQIELDHRVTERTQELVELNQQLKREIADRKQTEEALSLSEERYRSLFKNNHSVMLLIDPESGDIVDANPAAISFYGWSYKELTCKKITNINMFKQEKVFQEIEKAKKKRCQHFYFQHCLSSGEIRDVEVYSGPIKEHGRELLYSIIHDITDRKLAEKALKTSLKEKEILLREIHHRVKNNFEIICSLLDLSSMNTKNQEIQFSWRDVNARIHSMALIHSQLYECDRFDKIYMENYFHELMNYLTNIYGEAEKRIAFVIEPSEVYLSVNQAIPCALVLNELITNVFKHAFRERRKGTIQVSINNSTEGTVLIGVKDDGDGIPKGIDFNNTKGLGFKLSRHLVEGQLKGAIRVNVDNGTEICIEFKKTK